MVAIQFFDFDHFGRTDDRGNPLIRKGADAISNAITSFLTAERGGYVLQPTVGGLLADLEFRAQRGQLDQKASDISTALNNEFGAVCTIQGVTITPEDNRFLRVDVTFTVNVTQEKKEFSIFRKFVPKYATQHNYIPVEYIDDNLTNFVLAEALTQPKAPLFFNPSVNSWVWGPYKFVNLTTDSENFEFILETLNG